MAEEGATNGAAVEKTVSFSALKPRLTVEAPKAAGAIDFYKAAFGAVETGRSLHPKRKADQELPHILAAQLELAGSTIIVSDLSADSVAAEKTGSDSLVLCLETEDVEAAVAKAVAAGAVKDGEVTEGEDACGGGGVQAKLKDPYGFSWLISSPAKKKAVDDVDA